MIKKTVDNNFDSLFVVKEKRTVFFNDQLLVDGTIPKKFKKKLLQVVLEYVQF